MIYIQKKKEPSSFKNYKKTITPIPTFDGMHGDIKNELRNSLLEEQGYICAYCMKRIRDPRKIKIEHLQHRNSKNELDYHNLLAVCDGEMNNGDPNRFTCDTRKKDQEMNISPLNKHDMETIFYNENGRILSTEFQDDLDLILNLNDRLGYLIGNRAAVIAPIRKKLISLKSTQEAKTLLLKLQTKYTNRNDQNELSEYNGIILWYINKHLKQYQ